MAALSVEPFAITDLEDFLALSHAEYGVSVPANPDHIKWKHVDSPFGASTCINLVADGKVVGRAQLQPRPMYTVSKKLNVACVTDVLIDREHRSPPTNFINLTKATGTVPGFDLVYHTSNDRTYPLYSRLFRFPTPFSLQAFGFPLRLAGVLSKVIGRRFDMVDWLSAPYRWLLLSISYVFNFAARLDISAQPIGDDELDVLCTQCLRQSGPLLARTNTFLKWRFADAPLLPATVYRVDRDDKFLGYVVTCKLELNGLRHLVLMDFLLNPETPILVQVALRLWLIRGAITAKVDALFTMVNPFNSIARKCVGFPLFSIPDRLLPHATPIFVRSASNESKDMEADRSIHLTLADLDYF